MNLTAIRSRLADVISGVPDVRAYSEFPDQVATSSGSYTAVVLVPGDPYVADYHATMSKGLAEVRFRATIIIQRASIDAAQRRLDELLSSGTAELRSLIDVVQSNTATADWHHVHVERAGGVGMRTVGDVEYLGCDVDLVVRTGRA